MSSAPSPGDSDWWAEQPLRPIAPEPTDRDELALRSAWNGRLEQVHRTTDEDDRRVAGWCD